METAPFQQENAFSIYQNKIEEKRRNQILHTKNREVQVCSLATGVLLHDCVCKKLGVDAESKEAFRIGYESGGKPYLLDYPDIYFNLSHSGDYVCCVIADEPIGVDIQKHIDYREQIAQRFFTDLDLEYLSLVTEEAKQETFFRIWCRKESYGKLIGQGLAGSLNSFEIDWEQDAAMTMNHNGTLEPAAYFQECKAIPGYSLCVCKGTGVMFHFRFQMGRP